MVSIKSKYAAFTRLRTFSFCKGRSPQTVFLSLPFSSREIPISNAMITVLTFLRQRVQLSTCQNCSRTWCCPIKGTTGGSVWQVCCFKSFNIRSWQKNHCNNASISLVSSYRYSKTVLKWFWWTIGIYFGAKLEIKDSFGERISVRQLCDLMWARIWGSFWSKNYSKSVEKQWKRNGKHTLCRLLRLQLRTWLHQQKEERKKFFFLKSLFASSFFCTSK